MIGKTRCFRSLRELSHGVRQCAGQTVNSPFSSHLNVRGKGLLLWTSRRERASRRYKGRALTLLWSDAV